MAAELRRIGKNIAEASQAVFVDEHEFASRANMSVADVYRLFEGRLMLYPAKLKEVAKILNKSVSDLLDVSGEYKFVECMGHFEVKQNEDKILDIIDNYIDLLEAIS